jgi:hypothetical protein
MVADKFRINSCQRFYLVFVPLLFLGLLALKLGMLFWHVWSPSKMYDAVLVLVIIGLAALAINHLFRWFSFEVELSEEGINISGAQLRWDDLESVCTKSAAHFSSFSTLIELRSKDGRIYKIPACIQQGLPLLREIQQHLPEGRSKTSLPFA